MQGGYSGRARVACEFAATRQALSSTPVRQGMRCRAAVQAKPEQLWEFDLSIELQSLTRSPIALRGQREERQHTLPLFPLGDAGLEPATFRM